MSAGGQDTGNAARLIFRAGARRYALPTAAVREIARVPKLTRVPLAPPQLLGLGIVRGETLAVLAPESSDAPPQQLLVLDGASQAALAIDRVERLADDADGQVDEFALDALLDAALPLREKAARQGAGLRQRSERVAVAADRTALLRFAIADQSFALPLDQAEEVLRLPDAIARLPGADPAVIGTMAHRDSTLGLFSLAALLALPERESKASQRILVVRIGRHRIGLRVDRIEGLLHIAPDRIDPVPATLARSEGEARIAAICRPEAGGRLVSVLAADQLLTEQQTRHLLADAGPRRAAQAERAERRDQRQILPVSLGEHRLGFPLASVERVLARPARTTAVPGAPAWLVGVTSIGGEPIAIVDQAMRLTGAPAHGRRQRLLIVSADGARLGFLVDAVGTVLHADAQDLAPAPLPETLAAGVYGDALRLDGAEALLLLEPAALISAAERDLAARFVRTAQ